jgi:hypothetical protein
MSLLRPGKGAGRPRGGVRRDDPLLALDEFQVAYFTGEANWNYLVAPFLFARLPGKIEAQSRTAGRGSVTARSGDGASQLEAECALIEVSDPVESPLAGSTGESARSACHDPATSPMDGVRARRAGLVVVPGEHERVTIGCGQRLDVDIPKPSGQLAGPDTVM